MPYYASADICVEEFKSVLLFFYQKCVACKVVVYQWTITSVRSKGTIIYAPMWGFKCKDPWIKTDSVSHDWKIAIRTNLLKRPEVRRIVKLRMKEAALREQRPVACYHM
jgi:hypothetical protein